MIKSTIKILNKLMDNIEFYKVHIGKYELNNSRYFTVHYTYKNLVHTLSIDPNGICFYLNDVGTNLSSSLDAPDKYEILYLVEVLYNLCQDYTSTKMRDFADSIDDIPEDETDF